MQKFWGIFTRKQGSVRSAALVLMVMVMTSRVLGLVRDRLLSARFTPDSLGVYFAAFRLPNLIFELLVTGALTAAFIPVFTKFITQGKEQEANKLAATLINLFFILFTILAIPLFIWAVPISKLFAPGFDAQQVSQMASFTRFMFIFQVIPLLVGNFFTGILQSYNLFLIPAIAPVAYNVGIILGIIIFTPIFGLWAPVIGVGLGALLFMLVQIPLLIAIGYKHRLSANVKTPGVKEVATLMGPRTFGLAVAQIDTTTDLILSSLLGARMVTIFTFAQNLQQLPIGLFGTTVAQAALPTLSRDSAQSDLSEFKKTILKSISQILFFVLPCSTLFIVLRIPVVRLVFGAARFDWNATVLTGMTLSAFSVSLFAQSLVQVFTRAFYALYDSKTPVIVGVISILTNTIFSVVFVQFLHYPVWSLGISTSVASILNVTVLLILLDKKVGRFSRADLILPGFKMLAAAVIAALAIYLPLKLFDQLVFDTTHVWGLILLTGVSGGAGMAVYLFLAWVFQVGEVKSFIALIEKVRKPKAVIFEPVSEVVNGGIDNKLP